MIWNIGYLWLVFPPIPLDAIDSFYNDQGDICATKSDSKVDPVFVESAVSPAVVENNERYHSKPTGEEYRSKPKKKKRNQRQWINNKKIRWKDQPHVPSFTDHLLPKNDP